MPKNVPMAIKYWKEAAEKGNRDANAYLGDAYNPTFDNGRGVPQAERDWSKSVHYYEVAARRSFRQARHNLAVLHKEAGQIERAKKHFLISAKMGHDDSLVQVKDWYMQGEYTKDEFAAALRAHKDSQDEVKSEHRKNVIADNNHTWSAVTEPKREMTIRSRR